MKKVTTFLFLTTVIASSSAVADPFLSLFNPVGLEVVSDNNILIAHDNVTASVVSKFTPNSELLGSSVIEGVTGINTIGFLAEIPSTGQILDMLPDGRLLLLDPISGDTGLVLAMQSIPVDASAIVDIASGTIDAFEGLIQTQFSSFGDIAVFETDNLLDVFVTALSQAQTFPFVVRLRFVDGNFQEAKVLMSSRAEASSGASQGVRLTRGIAVNAAGQVLTTLPWTTGPGILFDALVTFNGDIEPADGISENEFYIVFDEPDIYSSGMTTDSQGNFYVATNTVGSAALGIPGASLLAVIDPNITAFLGTFTENRLAVSARDVSVDNARQFAYVSLEDVVVRYPLSGLIQ